MANQKNKKVKIFKKDLPAVNSNNQYYVRYRIISEDKNKISHWSPIFKVPALAVQAVTGSVALNRKVDTWGDLASSTSSISSPILIASWGAEEGRAKYDVFAQYSTATTSYVSFLGTTTETNYSFKVDTSATTAVIIVQVESLPPKSLYSNLEIFRSEGVPV